MIARAASWLRSLWWNLARRDQVDGALDDEIRTYVELLASEYEQRGLSPADARRAALIKTRGIEQTKEAIRDAWAGNTLATAQRELRYAMRTLRRAPAFVAIAVATLALGIGGSTAVFTVINGSLLRPLPAVVNPRELVTIERMQKTSMRDEISQPDYNDLRARTTTLTGIAGYNGTSMALGEPNAPKRVWISQVTDNFFDVLGVHAVVGRVFSEPRLADEGDIVVIGHDVWQHEFNASPSVVGSAIKLDGRTFTVVGVAPPKFIGAMALHDMEMWMPVALPNGRISPALDGMNITSRRAPWMRVVGRLAPGKSLEDVQRDLDATATILASTYPESNADRSFKVVPGSGMTPEERAAVTRLPRLLAIAVALLLLIACGNVAGLSLVRAAARRRELATRLALGASRATLVRQVAFEGALIAAVACALGIGFAALLVRSATLVHNVVDMDGVDTTIDTRVLAVAIAAATITAIVVSLFPALQVTRVPAAAVLKDGGAVIRRRRAQRVLVSAQIGASLVLLYGTALIFTAFQRVLGAHDGVDPRHVVSASLSPRNAGIDSAQVVSYNRTVLARISEEPGIERAALSNTLPPFQWTATAVVFRQGEEPTVMSAKNIENALRASTVVVSPGFFDVMRIPLIAGRDLALTDDDRAERVAVISRGLANTLWPNVNPIGRMLAWPAVEGPPRLPVRVVGIVGDTRVISGDADAPPAMYVSFLQQPKSNVMLIARTHAELATTSALIQRVAAEIDSRVPLRGVTSLDSRIRDEIKPQRTASAWVGVFGIIALVLAAIGLYGVAMQTVMQRTREIALRCALGAAPRDILASVVGDGMRLAIAGSIVGALGSIAAYRLVRSMFAGVEAADVRPAIAAIVLLGIVTLTATSMPARRAARLNPADALRSD